MRRRGKKKLNKIKPASLLTPLTAQLAGKALVREMNACWPRGYFLGCRWQSLAGYLLSISHMAMSHTQVASILTLSIFGYRQKIMLEPICLGDLQCIFRNDETPDGQFNVELFQWKRAASRHLDCGNKVTVLQWKQTYASEVLKDGFIEASSIVYLKVIP